MKSHTKTLLAFVLLFNGTALAQQDPSSQAKAEVYRCLSAPLGAANFTWSIQIAQDIPQKLDPRMNFDQLKLSLENSNQARDAIRDAIKKSLGLTVQNFSPMTIMKAGFNISTEILNLVNRFADNLRPALANIRVAQEMNFQIAIAPRLSDELIERRAFSGNGEVPSATQYPNDRIIVFQNLTDSDSVIASADDRMVTHIYEGISQYLHKAFECKLAQPFLTSTMINVKISPTVSESQVSSQIILGMPSGIEIPFKEANDQVQFQKIAFPTIDSKNLAMHNGGFPIASQYPVAIISMHQKLTGSTDIPVQIEFGPLGTYENKKWIRQPKVDYSQLVPKLKGVAVGNWLTRAVAIDFNIYNLSMNLAKQEVTDLDIFLSVGYRRLPNFKFGRINRTDVDTQFQTEMNKTIQQQINVQKENLKRVASGSLTPQEQQAVVNAVSKMGEQNGVSSDFTKQLVQALFGAMGAKP